MTHNDIRFGRERGKNNLTCSFLGGAVGGGEGGHPDHVGHVDQPGPAPPSQRGGPGRGQGHGGQAQLKAQRCASQHQYCKVGGQKLP